MVKACRLYNTKLLSKPMLPCWLLDLSEYISVKLEAKFESFHQWNAFENIFFEKQSFCLDLNVFAPCCPWRHMAPYFSDNTGPVNQVLCHSSYITSSSLHSMITSSNGSIIRVTGHLCGEFTGPWWIPSTKASDAELWCFLWSAPEYTVE